MKILKYLGPLIVALCIDGFDLLVALAIFVVFVTAPGTSIGAAAGGAACGTACAAGGGLLGFIADVIPFTHGAITMITIPLGEGFAQVIDFAVDATFGTGLAVLLIFVGLLHKSDFMSWRSSAFLAKLIPFIDMGPWYTVWVVGLIMRKEAEERAGLSGAAARTVAVAMGAQSKMQGAASQLGTAHRSGRWERDNGPQPTSETIAQSKPVRQAIVMQDVRPAANDNNSHQALAA